MEGSHRARGQCFDWRVFCGGCERRGWSPLSQADLHEQFPAGAVREQTPVCRHRCGVHRHRCTAVLEFCNVYRTNFTVCSLLLASAHKKKNKKKSKPSVAEAPALTGVKDRIVDRGFLCCTHHEVMVAGLAMLGMDAINNKGKCASIKKPSECLKRLHSKGMASLNFLIKDGV